MLEWIFVDTGASSGEFNMRFDERLAADVAAGRCPTTLRLFQWDPFCISLGRHQKMEDIDIDRCRRDGIDVVYRPTGGRAILHAEELTYSLVFGDEIRGSVENTCAQIGEALVLGLRSVGVAAELNRHQPDLKKWYTHPSSASCFASSTRYEVQVDGRKLVGSAQRRYPDAILQHGSILIGSYHRRLPEYLLLEDARKDTLRQLMAEKTVELRSLCTIELADLKQSIRQAFAETFSVRFSEETLPRHVQAT